MDQTFLLIECELSSYYENLLELLPKNEKESINLSNPEKN